VTLFAPLQEQPLLLALVAALFGGIVGSFLNVVIHRVPLMMTRQWRTECRELLELELEGAEADPPPVNLFHPPSHCPQCKTRILARDTIPVVSYLLLGGKCRSCQTRISTRYPLVEMLSAILTVVVALQFGFTVQALAAMGLTWALIALTFIDLDHHLLPDGITLPVMWAGLLISPWVLFVDPVTSLAGAAAGYLSLWIVYHLFRLLTGKEGMGHGDFKMLAMFGAWIGWQQLPLVVLLSSVVGAVVGIAMILVGRHGRGKPIPFGPYLAVAGWIALLWGESITGAYLNWATGT